jgi:hypothetical protein
VADAAGNAAEAVLTVSVPHDRASDAVDSGDAFEVVAAECGPMELCPPAPDPACVEAGSASVEIETGGKNGPSLRWEARDFPAAEGEFSNPAVDYQLCIYTEYAEEAVLESDPAAPRGQGWKHRKKGASYKGKKAPGAELDSVKLGEKKGGEGSLQVSLAGDEVELPELPLLEGTSLVLQLRDNEQDCVGSTFAEPTENTAERYSAEVGE